MRADLRGDDDDDDYGCVRVRTRQVPIHAECYGRLGRRRRSAVGQHRFPDDCLYRIVIYYTALTMLHIHDTY